MKLIQESLKIEEERMSVAGLNIQDCLNRLTKGDEVAARELFQHLHPLVAKIVHSHLPRKASAEDLIQIVFMKVFSNLDQYVGKMPLEHWVSRIAINTCYKQLRFEKVRPELRLSDLTEEESQVVEMLAETSEELSPDHAVASRDLVEKLLQQLSPSDRLLVTLFMLEGRALKEISQITGKNKILLKVRLYRARQKMQKTYFHLTGEKNER